MDFFPSSLMTVSHLNWLDQSCCIWPDKCSTLFQRWMCPKCYQQIYQGCRHPSYCPGNQRFTRTSSYKKSRLKGLIRKNLTKLTAEQDFIQQQQVNNAKVSNSWSAISISWCFLVGSCCLAHFWCFLGGTLWRFLVGTFWSFLVGTCWRFLIDIFLALSGWHLKTTLESLSNHLSTT